MLKIQTRRQARTELADYEESPSIVEPEKSASAYDYAASADIISRAPAPEYTVKHTAADIPERPKKPAVSLRDERIYTAESEDVKPTVKTRSYADGSEESTMSRARKSDRGLDSRTKVLLCIYIAVALVLAIAVIATGVAISRTAERADSLAHTVAQQRATYAEREAQLLELGNEESIRARAYAEGMVEAGEAAYTFDYADDYEYPEAKPRTNSFDAFCDWLSKIVN